MKQKVNRESFVDFCKFHRTVKAVLMNRISQMTERQRMEIDFAEFLKTAPTSRYSEVVEHIAKRGYALRKKWYSEHAVLLVYFGMDNSFKSVLYNEEYINSLDEDKRPKVRTYNMCLQDIKAEDWVCVPFFWNGSDKRIFETFMFILEDVD